MRHRSIKSRAGKAAVGAVLAGALGIFAVNTAEATLTLDLRAQDGTKAANVASGAPVTLDIFAVVQGAAAPVDGDITNDGFGQLFAAFKAVPSGGTPSGTLTASVASPFNVLGSNPGDAAGLQVGPDATVLANSNTDSPGTPGVDWFFATYRTPAEQPLDVINETETSAVGLALSFKIGELTLTPTGINGDKLDVKAFGRTRTQANVVAATWMEDNVIKQVDQDGSFLVGADVVITIGTVNPLVPGDADGDGDVDGDDQAVWASNFTGSGGTGGTHATGDWDGDADVDGDDLSIWASGFTGSISSVVALAAIPEPSALVGLSLLATTAISRRRRA